MNKLKIPEKRFWEDDQWAHDNYQTLLRNHPNKWVAVFQQKVVCAHKDLRALKKLLSLKFKGKTVPVLRIEDAWHVY